jgi:hypothetical protein
VLHASAAFSAILLFSWTQRENFSGGFQSQFILAQLVPLAAFYLLHRSAGPDAGVTAFAAACAAGIAALGTMANGVATLPLMTLLALRLRLPRRRTAILAALALLGPAAYFSGYRHPDGHGSLGAALFTDPTGLARYVLLYLGGPFYYMTGKGNRLLAQIAGLFLILSAATFAWRSWKQGRHRPADSLPNALLAFLLYIGASAVGTAGGRLVFGPDQALASRYQTPVLMAWTTLLALYAPALARRFGTKLEGFWLPPLVIAVLLAPPQFQALRSQRKAHFEQKVAALALELGIRDEKQVKAIFPSAAWALDLARIPVEKNLSIFDHPHIRDARQRIGAKAAPPPAGGVQSPRHLPRSRPRLGNFARGAAPPVLVTAIELAGL